MHQPSRTAQQKRVEELIAFCASLQERLPLSIDPTAIQTLQSQLHGQSVAAERFLKKPCHLLSSVRNDIDRHATDLWNCVTRITRDQGKLVEPPTILTNLFLAARLFSLQLVDIARVSGSSGDNEPEINGLFRIYKLGLRLTKHCLAENDVKYASEAIIKATNHKQELERLRPAFADDTDRGILDRLNTEWFILRTALSWKENRMDIAEHMYWNCEPSQQALDPASAESMSEVLLSIGKDFLDKNDFKMAIKWLGRAYEIISLPSLVELSRDAAELRLSIFQGLVRGLLNVGGFESLAKADDLISSIEAEIGDQPVVLLMRLEVVDAVEAEAFDSQANAAILRRMIKSFSFTDSHLKLLMHYIRKLYRRDSGAATFVVEDLFRAVMSKLEDMEWIERILVLRVWMSTSMPEKATQDGNIDSLLQFLGVVQENLNSQLNARATVAAQTLIWKRVEAAYSQSHHKIAARWCEVALHPLFRDCGRANLAKISRKLILCEIATNELDKALTTFATLPEEVKNETATRYLMYKVSVRLGNREVAADCLRVVAQDSKLDINMLYACVLDAQESGNKRCAVDAMKLLALRQENRKLDELHLPALLRCTIRLLLSLLENEDQEINPVEERAIIEDICTMFEEGKYSAVRAASRDHGGSDGSRLFIVKELDWFCKNAYNLGLQHMEVWNFRQIIRVFDSCLALVKLYPPDLPADKAVDLALKTMFCNFVVASALVASARLQDKMDQQAQDYVAMRAYVADFDSELQHRVDEVGDGLLADLKAKLATLLVFDFEAVVCLKKWDDLGTIVRKAAGCADGEAFKKMADCLLRQGVPAQPLYSTLKLLVGEIWQVEGFGAERLAKYYRLLFQAVLPLDGPAALDIIDKARDMASETQKFPPEELEWLVITAFNHAVELFSAREDEQCREWATKAINLAHYANDGGSLERSLHDRFFRLNLS